MLARFDPLRELDELFDGRFGRGRVRSMPLDAYRRGDTFFVHVDVPGVDPDTIEVSVDQDVLIVKAERIWEEKEGDELVACERPQGSFERRLYLSEAIDREHLTAHCKDGVLTVQMPVLEASKRHRIPISVAEGARSR